MGILDIIGVICIILGILGLVGIITLGLAVDIVLVVLGLVLIAFSRGALHL